MKVPPYKKFSLLGLTMLALCLIVSGAGASIVSIENGQVNTIGGMASLNLTLDSAPAGLSGYDINITLDDASIANINGVSFPAWATLKDNSSVPASFIHLTAVDLNDAVQSGATNVPLATIRFQGLKQGTTPVKIAVNAMDDDAGNMVSPGVTPGTFSVNIPQPVGNISVTSNPPGAAIAIDGNDTGLITPATIEKIPPGTHSVSVTLSGYQSSSQTVSVSADTTTQAVFSLVQIPKVGSISVTSTPSGAAISLDGTDTGNVTPFTLDNLVPGSHTVGVSLSGYVSNSTTVTISAGTTVQADFQLVPVPVTTGTLIVSSNPAGAAISIDGVDTGNVTPATFTGIEQGNHLVEVGLANYVPANKTVGVQAGGSVTADFSLVPVPTTGSLNVTSSPAGAAISLDGSATGKTTPFIFNDITPGDHTVDVSLAGYSPGSATIAVTTGETASADFQLVPVPQTGSIAVTSTPAGAGISLDGNDTGEVTPFTLDNVLAGTHTIDVSLPGYFPASQNVSVTTGFTANVDFQLTVIPPRTGSISVTSSPAGAEIMLDGTPTGKTTPAVLDSVVPGNHTVAVSLAGYNPASKEVAVSAGMTAAADFTLNQIPAKGTIAVSSTPAGASIAIDGVSTGKVTPSTLAGIAPGPHAVTVALDGYVPQSQTVTVVAGSTVSADFILVISPRNGSISITSVPAGASIALDGIATGKLTPSVIGDVQPGNHMISLTLTGYRPVSKTVNVTSGSIVKVGFHLIHTVRQADLGVTSTVSNATAYVGDKVIWTVTVVNNGPDAARDIVIRDDLSSAPGIKKRAVKAPSAGIIFGNSWRIPALQPGQSAQLTEVVTYASPGIKTDTTKIVKSGTRDPVTANNTATASVVIVAKPAPAPRVISISPSSGEAGSTIRNVVVRGDGFLKGAKITLLQQGGNSLSPTHVSVDGKGKITFSLTIPKNSPLEAFDVVVTNTDGQSGTLTGGFKIALPKPVPTQGHRH